MTDLEKRAKEYAIKVAEKNVMPKDGFAEHLIRQTYLDATKVETALLSQHIIDLQKDKGNLTDKVRELEQQIEKMKNSDTLCKLIGEQKREITELEAQIENIKFNIKFTIKSELEDIVPYTVLNNILVKLGVKEK